MACIELPDESVSSLFCRCPRARTRVPLSISGPVPGNRRRTRLSPTFKKWWTREPATESSTWTSSSPSSSVDVDWLAVGDAPCALSTTLTFDRRSTKAINETPTSRTAARRPLSNL